jgi:hypothetical protein
MLNIPKGHTIYKDFSKKIPPKCTPIGIFGLKLNHLATLLYIVTPLQVKKK